MFMSREYVKTLLGKKPAVLSDIKTVAVGEKNTNFKPKISHSRLPSYKIMAKLDAFFLSGFHKMF